MEKTESKSILLQIIFFLFPIFLSSPPTVFCLSQSGPMSKDLFMKKKKTRLEISLKKKKKISNTS